MTDAPQPWPQGRLIAFSALDGPTDYRQGMVLRTTVRPVGLEVVLPARAAIRFRHAPTAAAVCEGGAFEYRTDDGRSVRGALLDAHHLLISGDCSLDAMPEGLAVVERFGRLLVGAKNAFNPRLVDADLDAAVAARRQWLEGLAPLGNFTGQRAVTLRAALSFMKGQVCGAEGDIHRRWTSPDRWPHRDMWLWDSAFHAIGWRHVDPALAREMIDAVFDGQSADGFVPHQASPYRRTDMTQPPVLALAVSLVNDVAPDLDWVGRVYPKLVAYVKWDMANRDKDGGGLVEWRVDEDEHCRSGESGMDNSPRFDRPGALDAADFNAYLASECEVLADLAWKLGRSADAEWWRGEHARLCRLINTRLWSSEALFYFDREIDRGALSPVFASAGFMPLLCGAPTPEQAARLTAHVFNAETFGTPLGIPSIAASDTASYSKDLFRGPVWINVNWLTVRGLERYGFHEAADRVREQSLRESSVSANGTACSSNTLTTASNKTRRNCFARGNARPMKALITRRSTTSAGRPRCMSTGS